MGQLKLSVLSTLKNIIYKDILPEYEAHCFPVKTRIVRVKDYN